MKKLTRLTPDQVSLMGAIRDEWIGHGIATGPADREAAEAGVDQAYRDAGLEPPRVQIWFGSPMAGCIAAAMLTGQVWDQVWDQVGAQVGNQVGAQVWDEVLDQVLDQVRNQVSDQVWNQVSDQVRDQVGAQVGNQVGAQVWDEVWDQVGAQVGNQVLDQVRNQVGDQVRDQVSEQVGNQVGAQVLDQVWNQVRNQVGDQVGAQVRNQVGDQVSAQVGAQVWNQVWDQVSAQVLDQVWNQVREQVGAQVGAQVGTQVRDQVWAQVWDEVGDQVGNQVLDQVGTQVLDQVRDQVWNQVRDQVRRSLWGQHDAAYLAWADYWHQLGIHTTATGLMHVARNASWWWAFRDAAILTERPTILHRDGQGRLHNENGPAIQYPDGWGVYVLHGVRVPADLIETGWDTERIMQESNTEIRAAAIELTGWDKFTHQPGFTLEATAPDPGNPGHTLDLYSIPQDLFDANVRLLLCHNATVERDGTRKRYGLTVPASITDPVAAAAWTFNLGPAEYRALVRAT